LTISESYFGYQYGNIIGTAITINKRVRAALKHTSIWTNISDLWSTMFVGAILQTVQPVTLFVEHNVHLSNTANGAIRHRIYGAQCLLEQ
jgi:hypothetical protein